MNKRGKPSPIGNVGGLLNSGQVVLTSKGGAKPFGSGGNNFPRGGDSLPRGGSSGLSKGGNNKPRETKIQDNMLQDQQGHG
jgi:hypothetical protein